MVSVIQSSGRQVAAVGEALSRTYTNLVLGNSLLHAPNLNQQLAWKGAGREGGEVGLRPLRQRGARDGVSQSVSVCVLVRLVPSMMTETTVTVTTTEGAPGHNVTSQPTVKSDPGQGQNSLAWIRLNFLYFRTIPGILKLLQVVSYHPSRPQENCTSVGSESVAAVTGCDSVLCGRQLATFRRTLYLHLLLPQRTSKSFSFTQKMEAVGSSETAPTCQPIYATSCPRRLFCLNGGGGIRLPCTKLHGLTSRTQPCVQNARYSCV
jgi:hypothetical protein